MIPNPYPNIKDLDLSDNKTLSSSKITSLLAAKQAQLEDIYDTELEQTSSGAVMSFKTAVEKPIRGTFQIDPSLDGVSAVNVVRTGKNLLNDAEAKRGYYTPTADGPSYNADNSYISYDVFLKKGTYCFSTDLETCYIPRYFKGNTEHVVGSQVSYVSFTLSTDTNFKITIRKNPASVITDLPSSMIELGNQATAYSPYSATTRTISLGQTVYGGSVTVDEDGECELEDGYTRIDLGSLTWTYYEYNGRSGGYTTGIQSTVKKPTASYETSGSIGTGLTELTDNAFNASNDYDTFTINISGLLKIAISGVSDSTELKNALSGIYLTYPKATPTQSDLDPIAPIETIVGENNIWADTGSGEIVYMNTIRGIIENNKED